MTARKNVTTGGDAANADAVAPDTTSATANVAPDTQPEAAAIDTQPAARSESAQGVRQAALSQLVALAPGDPVPTAGGVLAQPTPGRAALPDNPASLPESADVDGGGDLRRLVIFDVYRLRADDGRLVEARRGTVVKVTQAEAERGKALGGLRELDADQ